LQNYRSNLSAEQIKDWQEVLKGTEIRNGSKIDRRYLELQKADPKTALQILASFDAQNALQMDIAREYLSTLDKQALENDEKLAKLFELLKETKKFPFETLGELLIQKANKIKLEDDVLYRQVTIKLYGKGVFVRQEVLGSEIRTESQFVVNEGDFIMSKIDARNGAFGIVPAILDGAVVTSSFPYFEIKTDKVNPKYLEAVVTQKSFYDQINKMVSGATGRRSVEVDNFLELQIPLPLLEVQNEIVEKIEKQKQIIEGAERIEGNMNFEVGIFDEVPMSDIFNFEYGITKSASDNGKYRFIRITDINSFGQLNNEKVFTDIEESEKRYILSKGDLVMARTGATFGKVLYFDADEDSVFASYLIRFVPKKKINNKFVYYFCLSKRYWEQANLLVDGGTQPQFSSNKISKVKIPLPPLETQRQIVEKLDMQMQALEGVRLLKSEAEKRIEEILAGVWGE